MVTLTVDDLKEVIHMDLIKNNAVRTDDVILSTKAYGLGVGETQIKTTRS